jgi:hypothetical protein
MYFILFTHLELRTIVPLCQGWKKLWCLIWRWSFFIFFCRFFVTMMSLFVVIRVENYYYFVEILKFLVPILIDGEWIVFNAFGTCQLNAVSTLWNDKFDSDIFFQIAIFVLYKNIYIDSYTKIGVGRFFGLVDSILLGEFEKCDTRFHSRLDLFAYLYCLFKC